MNESIYLRVTDEVKPRREYTITRSQLSEAHTVLDKPATAADGTPLPAKHTPAALAGVADGDSKKSPAASTSGPKASKKKE